jgi:uncharacterized protein involved in exopolysaccharide biosynthesis
MNNQATINDEIDLREYIEVLTRRWKAVAIVALAIIISAFIFSKVQEPIFEAKTTLLLRSSAPSAASQFAGLAGMLGINMNSSVGNLGDLTELMKSRAVGAKVLADLKLRDRIKGWNDPRLKNEDLASSVVGMLKPAKTIGNIMEIKVESNDAQLSADLANGFVAAITYYWNELNYSETQKKLKYVEAELPRVEKDLKKVESKLKLVPLSTTGYSFSGQGNIQRDYDIYNSVYTMLKKELESTKLEASKEIPPFSVIDTALKPKYPVRPKIKLNIMIGTALGLFAGVFFAFLQEYWEKSSKA